MKIRFRTFAALLLVFTSSSALPAQSDLPLRSEAERALQRAVHFYRNEVASHGGYVYYYNADDLSERWGEGAATREMIFVQPPGTPTVGMAYLKAYEATGEREYLDAAVETAGALVQGQLESGGWGQVIYFAPHKRYGKYRRRKPGKVNNSSLDDGQTQSALQFLMRVDEATKFADAEIHEAVEYGLNGLLAAQFASGGFPQVWSRPASEQQVVRASYPDYDWKTAGRVKEYWDYYTLNDGLAGTVAETLIVAHQIYGDDKYRAALEKLGDFLLLAQMPDPQPAWCQQYNYEMVPMWARKFEPPAIATSESEDVLRTLIKIAQYTGNEKYLEPVPRALAYLRTCELPDGNVARFYELETNKPLYMDGEYQLTYDGSSAPSHYGWKHRAKFDAIEKQYEQVRAGEKPRGKTSTAKLESRVRQIIRDLDQHGRWVSTYDGKGLSGSPKFRPGFEFLSSKVFSENVGVLSEYLSSPLD